MWQYHEDSEANRVVDTYIFEHYYYLPQISGLYPKMDGRNRIFTTLQLIISVLTLLHQMAILIKSTIALYGFDMVLLCQNVHFCLLIQIALITVGNCLWKHFSLYDIHRLLSYDFYDYQEPPGIGEELLRSTMETERRRLNCIPIGVAIAAGVVLALSPIIDFNAGSFDFNRTASVFSHHLPMPFTQYPYHVKDGFGFGFALFGQLGTGFLLTAIIGGAGFLFINLTQNISLQLKILNNSLENIDSRIEHLYSKLFGKMDRNIMKSLRHDSRYAYCYTKCLRKNFEHHQVILKSFHLLEDICSLPMGISYLTGTIVIALSLISTGSAKELPGTTMAAMILCVVEVSYMFLFSAVGQRFTDLSNELRCKMYNTRWYMCSKEIKSSLMIFEEMTLKPMTMTGARIVPANMETFTTVMNAAYSYYNLVVAFDIK
ncbi:odorant receptor 4 [Halyomorpha halys]|uniref:odorant receptor 4 n=1 Tax=Halyomorpha halys TaxID=286706 RepID=UPI0034D1DE22